MNLKLDFRVFCGNKSFLELSLFDFDDLTQKVF